MSQYSDAIGYLKDLKNEVGQGWFSMICDTVLQSTEGLSDSDIEVAKAIYVGIASYVPLIEGEVAASQVTTPTQSYFLEKLNGFNNFKKIQDTFSLEFDKQVTIIFGYNGSGKSSICDAIKILANHDSPDRPIHNVRVQGNQSVSFLYKFNNDSSESNWEQSLGYGSQHEKIKYFDSSVAAKSIHENIEPGTVVELTPFNMTIFQRVKEETQKFRESLQGIERGLEQKLVDSVSSVQKKFDKFTGAYLSSIQVGGLSELPDLVSNLETFEDQDVLEQSLKRLEELEKASSEEGQKLISTEIRDCTTATEQIDKLNELFDKISEVNPGEKKEKLKNKLKEQSDINEGIVPNNGDFEKYVLFLKSASEFCDFNSNADQECPLCRRPNEIPQNELFKKYSELIGGQLDREIRTLKTEVSDAESKLKSVENFDVDQFDKLHTLQEDMKKELKELMAALKLGMDKEFNLAEDFDANLKSLNAKRTELLEIIKEKKSVEDTAKKGREEIEKEKKTLKENIQTLQYKREVNLNILSLKEVDSLSKKVKFWKENLPKFTQLLRKLTDKEKEAHEDLVVSDFHKRLEAEYRSIAEKEMASFGVDLSKRGSATGVSVLARVGGKKISSVLSEGEQRLHSLALFFAEMETSKQSVIVFDDPVSSFDYDYISNYCFRLRDFVAKHQDRQIIVLTHNWEFFVNLQLILNKHHLHDRFSVQVMESCSSVSIYSEKIDELKTQISNVLSESGEPSKEQKEFMAGRMRRLIESVVNSHVFNGERHQFKQKSSSVSVFEKFTKITPLLDSEATELKDLFSKLSITEHDDPRIAYVNTDKAVFQTRYDRILSIEQAIISRKK